MSEGETWRVVLTTGEVRSVNVYERPMGAVTMWITEGNTFGPFCRSARSAVTALTMHPHLWDIAEVRGPGELTTAEQVEAMRAKCEAVCDGLFNTLDLYDGASGACDCRDAIKALKL